MARYGTAAQVIEQRQQVLNAAYRRNPERFTHAARGETGHSTLNSFATCLMIVDTFRVA